MSLAGLFLFGAARSAFPQVPPQQGGPSATTELAPFVDKFFGEQMERLHIPGAVVVLLKDGQLFYAKGYVYADLDKKMPVSPEKTIFRLASVMKTFTATAVMQLAESGKLNLTDDAKYVPSGTISTAFRAFLAGIAEHSAHSFICRRVNEKRERLPS